jgi:hypothetical protein
MFLKIFVEKLAWNLYGQNFAVKFQRYYRLEPCIESLVTNTPLDMKQAVIPYIIMVVMHLQKLDCVKLLSRKKGTKVEEKKPI